MVLIRNFMLRSKNHKVQATRNYHLRQPRQAGSIQPCGPTHMKAAGDVPRHFAESVVENAVKEPLGNQFFHGRSADSVGVEDDKVQLPLLELSLDAHQWPCGISKHGGIDRPPAPPS